MSTAPLSAACERGAGEEGAAEDFADVLTWRVGPEAGEAEGPTGQFPFEKIAAHSMAQSTVAKDMLERLRADVEQFASATRAARTPVFSGLGAEVHRALERSLVRGELAPADGTPAKPPTGEASPRCTQPISQATSPTGSYPLRAERAIFSPPAFALHRPRVSQACGLTPPGV